MSFRAKVGKWPGVVRCGVLVLALAGLAGQASDLPHWLLVPHRTCDEHGELVHAEAGSSHVAGSSRTSAMDRPELWRVANAPASHGSHDHCILSFLRHETTSPGGPGGAVPVASPPRAPVWLAHEDTPLPLVALYLIAPKNSPPASA